MFRAAQDWLGSFWAYLHPQPPAPIPIHSARDWLDLPSPSVELLELLHTLVDLSITVSLPFRITKAWECEEANHEDIVYIEAIMPSTENIPPEIRISEERVSVLGKYKVVRFLVCHDGYKELRSLQKNRFEQKSQEIDDINRFLIRHYDESHILNLTSRMPAQKQAEIKQYYLDEGLIISFDYSSPEEMMKELTRLVRERKR